MAKTGKGRERRQDRENHGVAFCPDPGRACGVVGYHARLACGLREGSGSIPDMSIRFATIFVALPLCPLSGRRRGTLYMFLIVTAEPLSPCVRGSTSLHKCLSTFANEYVLVSKHIIKQSMAKAIERISNDRVSSCGATRSMRRLNASTLLMTSVYRYHESLFCQKSDAVKLLVMIPYFMQAS